MCGIVGIYAYGKPGGVTPDVITQMRDTMGHRGPDGADLWISDDARIGFGHRRLSFIDLSNLAKQPMPNEDGRVWITFNGEIYNHARYRAPLEQAGHRFRTDHSDTEILVHGYEEWGLEGLLERISGDYAFGIYDADKDALFLARDRIGVKPLYFAVFDGEFVFGSEIKALLEHPKAERDIDPFAMVHYLSFLTTPAPMTMFKGIYKVPAGCWLKVEADGRISMQRHFDAAPGKGIDPSETKGLSNQALEDFYVGGIKQRLHDAVERRMIADVPIGVFLSGGIDSSANVALMSQFSDKPINTFTVGFKDFTGLNELDYANIAAKRFNTNHHEVLIDENDMIGYLDSLIHHQDEPLADWVCIPLYFVSKLASDNGIKGVQVGEGSDEQFCGYSSYMGYLQLYHKYWSPFRNYLPRPLQRAAAMAVVGASNLNPRLPVYADIIDRASRDREHFWSGAMVFWNTSKDRLMRYDALGSADHHLPMIEAGVLDPSYLVPDSYNVIQSFLKPFDAAHGGQDALTRMIHNEFRLRLPELLLMRVDKISMSVSLEARVPFLDHELVDFTFDIPEEWKTKNGTAKYLLKKAVEGLIPHELIYRKKMGFGAPMADWLRGSFGERVERELLGSSLMERGFFNLSYIQDLFAHHRSKKADVSLQIWTLYNLSSWYDYWIGGKRAQRGH
ncbi:asparagine synthase (glutamine-hydrolyzing) [Nitratireductor sp. StC3]|uniref:asparagine synthase (glutamine-hydrolyzing) n=1 Tax=Nitratireductor sp. StC3 TaxID=2126741 RepID=UPI000D0DDC03|nr:asparagine synthase (glutamine-hydrolyzing) [Nitratireductor sp. StC3]PSM18306.1 asparagine synthase (glutamine-hydrolyzing) [Nitratireductor sp. StC3]